MTNAPHSPKLIGDFITTPLFSLKIRCLFPTLKLLSASKRYTIQYPWPIFFPCNEHIALSSVIVYATIDYGYSIKMHFIFLFTRYNSQLDLIVRYWHSSHLFYFPKTWLYVLIFSSIIYTFIDCASDNRRNSLIMLFNEDVQYI